MSFKAFSDNGIATGTFDAIYIGSSQKITTSGSSQQGTQFHNYTSAIRLYCTQDVYIQTSTNPTATTTTSLFLPANTVEYFAVNGSDKLACIQATASGTLYITEGDVV